MNKFILKVIIIKQWARPIFPISHPPLFLVNCFPLYWASGCLLNRFNKQVLKLRLNLNVSAPISTRNSNQSVKLNVSINSHAAEEVNSPLTICCLSSLGSWVEGIWKVNELSLAPVILHNLWMWVLAILEDKHPGNTSGVHMPVQWLEMSLLSDLWSF